MIAPAFEQLVADAKVAFDHLWPRITPNPPSPEAKNIVVDMMAAFAFQEIIKHDRPHQL